MRTEYLILILLFAAMPAYSQTWSFTTVSDTYSGLEGGLDETLQAVFANNNDVKFIISTGDFENLDTIDSKIQTNLKQYFPSQTYVPWFTAIGNHNAEVQSRMTWISGTLGPRLSTQLSGMSNFKEGPYTASAISGRYTTYSFDYQNAHFIMLNQFYGSGTSDPIACIYDPIYNWLAGDLASNTKPIIFVFGHEPAFVHESSSNHCGDSLDDQRCPGNSAAGDDSWKAYRPARDMYWALLRQYNVTAHIDGHIHEYSARVIKGFGDFPTASCIDTEWNCYCDVEGQLPEISNGASLTAANGVIEFNNGITNDGPGHVIRIDGSKVTFSTYGVSGSSLSLYKQFTYTAVSGGVSVPDMTAPLISSVSSGSVTASGASITWTTNEASDSQMEYGTATSYGSSTALASTMVTSHAQALSGLSASTTYHYRVKSRDAAGNLATSGDYTFTTSAVSADTTPPVRSGGQPSGTLAAGTTSATLTLSTNEAATCRYSASAGTAYASMTAFTASGSTSHSKSLTGLSAGSYTYYVKCSDAIGNANTDDYPITFTIASSGTGGRIIYVDKSISSGSCTTYNPSTKSCTGGTSTAYKTLAGAANVPAPGDTVLIRAGSFTEELNPLTSGTANNYITYKNYPGETVTITGSNLFPAILLENRQYIIIEGLNIDNVWGWAQLIDSNYNIIRNCAFTRALDSGTRAALKLIRSDYNQILDNKLDDGNDNLMLEDSDRNLIQGNTITKGRHTLVVAACSNYNIIRDNFLQNPSQKGIENFDCEGAVGSTYMDDDQVYKMDATKHNIWENNIFAGTRASGSDYDYNAMQYSGQNGIVRNNVYYDNLGGGIHFQVYDDEAVYNYGHRVYANTIYNSKCEGLAGSWDSPSSSYGNNIVKNTALYKNTDCSGSGNGIDVSTNGAVSLVSTTSYSADPGFVNAASHDFHLTSSSTLIDKGSWLAKTSAAGSGTSLKIDDAGYFSDGYGVPGATGDTIQLQGQTQIVRVTAIDYATNTLTLDRSLTWTSGLGVSLAYSGAAPDIGAFEYGSAVPNPVCGQNGCENGETCTSCPADCGSCQLQCVHEADLPVCDNCVDHGELMQYIQKWKQGNAALASLMEGIRIWKQGC